MDIDVILDARATADELAELGLLAEQNGIRTIWVSSLLDSRDPFTNLSVLARETTSILLGVIAVNPYDTHPVRIATALMTLNELAGGRARTVIGGGGEALAALGIKPVKRVRAVRECVEIIKRAASGELMDYDGGMYSVEKLQLRWLQTQSPPVYVGASMPQMLRMAARVSDGAMLSDLPTDLAAQAVQTVYDALDDNGRGRADFWLNVFSAWHVYADREAAYDEARQWLLVRGLFRPWVLETFLSNDEVTTVMDNAPAFVQAFHERNGNIRGISSELLDKLVEHLTFAGDFGSIENQIAHLQAYKRLGLSAVALRLYRDPADSIRLLGEKIVPALL